MSLKYLITILYRPRATMRRILASADRWSVQVVVLAAICSSVTDTDARRMSELMPNLNLVPAAALVVLAVIVNAVSWLILWVILSSIALGVGKLMAGVGTARDVRAAFAWALVPAVWSLVYRLPALGLLATLRAGPQDSVHKILADFFTHGGCSMLVVYLFFQFLFEIACVVLASFTLAEAERFSLQKGFVAVASTLALPILVILAAIFSFRS